MWFSKTASTFKENVPIVNNPDFENGIINIQLGIALSLAEMEAVRMFKKQGVASIIGDLSYYY